MLINAAQLRQTQPKQPCDVHLENRMPLRKDPPTPRHPTEAMVRLDRLLKAMAPKVLQPEGAAPKPIALRGKRKPAHTR